MTPHYNWLYGASIVVTTVSAMLGAVLVAADALELSRAQLALIGILTAGLGVLGGFLPRVTKPAEPARVGMD